MMHQQPSRRNRIARRLALGVLVPFTVFAAAAIAEGPAPETVEYDIPHGVTPTDFAALPVAPTAPAGSGKLSLAECQALALHGHPRLAAQHASLAAAEDGSRAVDSLRLAPIVAHEVPIRRKQASIGVGAATAALHQTEHDVVYAVTRTYFTVLFAREQEVLARGVVDRLTATYETAQKMLKAGARDVSSADVNRTLSYLRLAETRRVQAAQGEKRALAALKEAVGQGPQSQIDVPPARLPEPKIRPNREHVVAEAIARRGELIQAHSFTDVVCLEIDAQGTSHMLKMETFAAGSDIHCRPIPPVIRTGEYRPGGIPPEMPTMLAGSRSERMKHASSLKDRAESAAEETRNLIVLETEDAFLRWEEATAGLPLAKESADTADTLANDLSKDLSSGLKVKVEDVVNARVLASQARSQYNELRYRQILALADLERATGGGFCPKLAELAAAMQQPPKK